MKSPKRGLSDTKAERKKCSSSRRTATVREASLDSSREAGMRADAVGSKRTEWDALGSFVYGVNKVATGIVCVIA